MSFISTFLGSFLTPNIFLLNLTKHLKREVDNFLLKNRVVRKIRRTFTGIFPGYVFARGKNKENKGAFDVFKNFFLNSAVKKKFFYSRFLSDLSFKQSTSLSFLTKKKKNKKRKQKQKL